MAVLDLLAQNPYCTVKGASEQLAVAFTTAQRGIERLAKAGIVTEITQSRRDRVYCAKRLLAILEEPASLEPMPA